MAEDTEPVPTSPVATTGEPDFTAPQRYDQHVRFSDLVGSESPPAQPKVASRTAVDTDSYLDRMNDEPRNNGFVSGLVDRRRGKRLKASRRGFIRGLVTTAAATTAVSAANLFGPARRVEAQGGIVGSYPRRIMQFCPPLNANDNCQPGCGSSPICIDCCTSDGFFRNDPANGYTLFAGGCGDGDIADGWLWRFAGKCGNCAEIEYRCSDGFVQTDTGPAPFICRAVTDCVPLAEGEAPGAELPDAARSTNWRPAGALEIVIDQGGAVLVNGWIADGSGAPVQMRIRANNAIVHFGNAALPRPDIDAAVRGAGPNTGFAVSFPIAPGQYEFCVDALAGVNQATIGCVNLNVGSGGSARGSGSTGSIAPPPAPTTPPSSDDSPVSPAPTPTPGVIVLPEPGPRSDSRTYGAVQVIRRSGETTGFASGWAGDPDTADPAFIDVLVDGESAATIRTELPRPDVASAFSELNDTTGFAVSFPMPAEAAEVCVVAVSPDDGRRQPLGCQQLAAVDSSDTTDPLDEASTGRPTASGPTAAGDAVVYGGIDSVDVAETGAAISGWSFDPNERDRVITIDATASGISASTETGVPNEAAQRIYGVEAACGFELDLELPAGSHSLTVVARTSTGANVSIGEQTIVVP